MPRKIALTLAYNGAGFAGWQVQTGQRTVQNEIEEAIFKVVGQQLTLAGSGRTDSGVHARGQVAAFITENTTIKAEQFAKAINSKLNYDVRIISGREVPLTFDARRHAIRRIYRYRIRQAATIDPLTAAFCFTTPLKLNLNRLNQLAGLFVGWHNFNAFCSSQDANKNKVRLIYKSYFVMEGSLFVYHIEGNAFLMKMVRSIVGTILNYYSKDNAEQIITQALTGGQRSLAGTTAKACGLSLEEVIYNEDYQRFF